MGADGERRSEEGGAEEAGGRERERKEGLGVLWFWGLEFFRRVDERETEAGIFWEGEFFFGCEGLFFGVEEGGEAETFLEEG